MLCNFYKGSVHVSRAEWKRKRIADPKGATRDIRQSGDVELRE